jgi:hypothetical protein
MIATPKREYSKNNDDQMSEPCRHCEDYKATKPRGLCLQCYSNYSIRLLYPSSAGVVVNRGWHIDVIPIELPEPTKAMPGTREKLAVLCQRFEDQKLLWHPDDAKETFHGAHHASEMLNEEVKQRGRNNTRHQTRFDIDEPADEESLIVEAS